MRGSNMSNIEGSEAIPPVEKLDIISKESTEKLKLDKKKKKTQKEAMDKVKDIIYAILIFLARLL